MGNQSKRIGLISGMNNNNRVTVIDRCSPSRLVGAAKTRASAMIREEHNWQEPIRLATERS